MTKNIPIRVKGWLSVFSHAIAFCLLCCSIVSVAYAGSNDLEIAFATVSEKADEPTKTAGCIIVWSTGKTTPNIYCRYELEKSTNFLRDNDLGIKLDDVKLFPSANKTAFQTKIKSWFENKKLTPTPTDLSSFADVMSRLNDEPKILHFVLEEQSALRTNEDFAAAVHRLIKEKIPDKVVAELRAMLNAVQEKAEEAIAMAPIKENTADDQADKKVDKIVADAKTTSLKPDRLELTIILFSIVLLYLLFIVLFIWLFWNINKLKNSETFLETNINKNVSTFSQEIANLKAQHTTLQKRLDEMLEKQHSEREEKITQSSPVEAQVENEPSSQDSYSDYRKEIEGLKGENSKLENQYSELEKAKNALNTQFDIERKKFKDTIRNLEQKQRSHNAQLRAKQDELQRTENSLKDSQNEVEKLNEDYQLLDTDLKNSKAEYKKEYALRKTVEETLAKTRTEVQTTRTIIEKNLENELFDRFRLIKPKEMNFTRWTTALAEQPSVWRWLQPALLGELLICDSIFKGIQKLGAKAKKDQDILNLLNLDSIMAHWRTLVGKLFERNEKPWGYIYSIDSEQWLNQLLRADDILETYFREEKNFKLLSQHLSNVTGILRAALQEMEVTILAPKILEAVPEYVPANKNTNLTYTPKDLLKGLVKEKVQNKFKEMSQFVVDVERYGFRTADHPDAAGDVHVFVYNPSDWE